MNLHIIYTAAAVLISKKRYESWQGVQDEYPDYRASLGPWSIKETEEYLDDEYQKIYPSASEQLRGFAKSSNTVHIVSFSQI
ncbi:hypothetical protein ACIPF8_24190 [Collimonas sp. NPDC087041]|uniref:hypothetical protein n=1 Tax=Collimonas sp. NPDC087041 TaxID=3363960 RepID=UPI0037F8F8C7